MAAVLQQVAPVMLVRNLQESLAFWRDKVGFNVESVWGDPPGFAIPERDGVHVMLAQLKPGEQPPPPNWKAQDKCSEIYIWVDDADALYEELIGRGTAIDFTIYDTPWGTREFGIQDLEERDIAFGQILR